MEKKLLWTFGALLAATALAAFLRLYDLKSFPAGVSAAEVTSSQRGLFAYLYAASVYFFGSGVWQLKLVAAIVGILTVPVIYFATRVWFGRLSGVLAATFLATSHWHVTLSRTGLREILVPFFIALFTALVGYVILSVKKNKKNWSFLYAALAGIVFAAGFYIHPLYRFLPGAVLVLAVLILLDDLILEWRKHKTEHVRDLPHVMRYWQQFVLAVVLAVLVAAPVGWFFAQEPSAFLAGAQQVSVFNQKLQQEHGGTVASTLWYSTQATVGSFFVGDGDANWQHSVPGFPLLNLVVAVLFLLGTAWTIQGTGNVVFNVLKGKEVHLGAVFAYFGLLLLVMLLPVVFTAISLPNAARSAGLIFPIFALAGTAASVVFYWLRRQAKSVMFRSVIVGSCLGVVAALAVADGSLYFLIARNSSAAYFANQSDLFSLVSYLQQNSEENSPYVVLDKDLAPVVNFLGTGRSVSWQQLDLANSHLVPLALGQKIIFTHGALSDADRYEVAHADQIQIIEQRFNRFNQEIFRVYGPAERAPTPGLDPDASLDA